ncbi:FAD-dependent oxidoreductase [Pseudaquabacterium rugosum]|uniref:FAD-dependent oxidoreductase n=1 Tax=Pseudaquabacterium rugosum TaxID=2984194 RepID=A0ABU9BCG7_9BURK
MPTAYTWPTFDYRRPAELDAPATVTRHPVIVVGAGPVGLSCAIDLAQRGQPVLLLDEDDTVSTGSRGLCYAQRTLQILDRQGCGDAVVDKGVTWNVGRTFVDTEEVFRFDLCPEPGHERPGMVNLQQYWLEDFQIARARELPALQTRFRHRVVAVRPEGRGATLEVETPDGRYTLACDWLVVCDGARSPIRRLLGLDIEGRVFQDRFLIADVRMAADFPAERWFWFDPPFHRGQSVLLHRQADGIWRIDFQLGWDADPEAEKRPERVIPRIQALLGDARPFELEWVSVYTFQCRRMARFRHGPVLFAGDAAHQVSPFGARGANSGIQDADNLGWKLAAVIAGAAPDRLLDSYSDERAAAADENLLNSTRSTDFITPKSATSRLLRQAVLGLAREHAFARALVNSGRLSVPATLAGSVLNTPDAPDAGFGGWMVPGAPADDAPLRRAADGQPQWLLRGLAGTGFTLLVYGEHMPEALQATATALPLTVRQILPADADAAARAAAEQAWVDAEGLYARRYDARPGTVHLIRPDQHVAARWRTCDAAAVQRAVQRALCLH